MRRRNVIILTWLATTLALSGYLTARFKGDDRRFFLPGQTSHGHYQIEMSCAACHTPMMGVKQDACLSCHEHELKLADDSHPPAKFLDPRQADRVAKLDVTQCITCHVEHKPEVTTRMGVTLPRDFCAHCHETIATERPSHAGMAFSTCATAGCHNFHDNRALHEDFWVKHLDEPEHLDSQVQPARNLYELARSGAAPKAGMEADAPASVKVNASLHADWLTTAHARAGVNCRACHESAEAASSGAGVWTDHPTHIVCASCHEQESAGFLAGHHGMRLSQNLPAMTPGEARLPMKASAAHETLSCTSCHAAHRFDTRFAAAQACVSCHDDTHSRAFEKSTHGKLWAKEIQRDAGEQGQREAASGEEVSCATCHMPRQAHRENGVNVIRVQHNQNDNLRPSDKMARSVCMNCHGLAFAVGALADPALIDNNFSGQPSRHIESADMVRRKLEELERSRQEKNNNTK